MHTAERIAAGALRRAANRKIVFSSAVRSQAGTIAAAVLAAAPTAPEPYTGPLSCDVHPTIVRVDVEPIDVTYPSVRTPVDDHVETNRAAVRAQLVNGHEYGPRTHVSVMVSDGITVRTIVLEGTVAAVRQAFPDHLALVDLANAGATEFLDWALDQTTRRTVKRVGVFRAPRALQIELETRGLAARIRTLAAAVSA